MLAVPKMTEREMTTKQKIEKARQEMATVRTLRRNRRQGLYQGRNGGGDHAEAREQRVYGELIELATTGAAERRLVGMVTGEHKLAERVSIARDAGQDRPELRDRLGRERRELKAAVA